MGPILITGDRGLIGSALRKALAASGQATIGLDLRGIGDERGDVRVVDDVGRALRGVSGVVHFAAVSRVIEGERDPQVCFDTNVGGVRNVLDLVAEQAEPPWFVLASSREVYGQATTLPASEATPLVPLNAYGRSKVEGEALTSAARDRGVRAAILRFSNVYGSTDDYADRVVPAFARAALAGGQLRVDGADHTFDFTHLDDTIAALLAVIGVLQTGAWPPPPVHVVTGHATTLRQLAELAIELAGTRATIIESAPRTYDVARFWGNPARAHELLGWQPQITIRAGLARLLDAYRSVMARST